MGLKLKQSNSKQNPLARSHSRYHPRHVTVGRLSAAALPREFLISLGLIAIAVPSIAKESATGMLVAGAAVVFARSNAH
jgi:hypothetical protein